MVSQGAYNSLSLSWSDMQSRMIMSLLYNAVANTVLVCRKPAEWSQEVGG